MQKLQENRLFSSTALKEMVETKGPIVEMGPPRSISEFVIKSAPRCAHASAHRTDTRRYGMEGWDSES